MRITGLDKLQRDVRDAEAAFAQLDGDLCTVSFTADDPSSIDAAIREMERIIDDRVGRYASNPLVAPMIESAKESFRRSILGRAAAVRLGDDDVQ